MAVKEKKLPKGKQTIANKICKRLGNGESLRAICETKGMPHHSTVLAWVRDFPAFANQYARAREEQADFHFDEMVDISDDAGFDYEIVEGKVIVNGDAIQRARLRIDTRKFTASKMRPRIYGDKLDLTVTIEAPPLTIVFNVSEPKGDVRVTKS